MQRVDHVASFAYGSAESPRAFRSTKILGLDGVIDLEVGTAGPTMTTELLLYLSVAWFYDVVGIRHH